jgi:hypothetical protein
MCVCVKKRERERENGREILKYEKGGAYVELGVAHLYKHSVTRFFFLFFQFSFFLSFSVSKRVFTPVRLSCSNAIVDPRFVVKFNISSTHTFFQLLKGKITQSGSFLTF